MFLLFILSGWLAIAEAAQTILVTAAPYNAACNGSTNDVTAIQSAINALPGDGGVLQFPNTNLCGIGTAGLSVAQRKDVTFQGLGTSAGLKALGVGPAFGSFGATMLALTNCYGCRITGMTFNGNALNANLVGIKDSMGVRVDGNSFTSAGLSGAVVASGNRNNRYERNTITAGTGSSRGLWIGNPTATEYEVGPQIVENTITSPSATAIGLVASNAEIRGNILTGTGSTVGGGIAISGEAGWNSTNVVVTDNTITNWAFHGVQSDVGTDTNYTSQVTVATNVIRGNKGYGIMINRARNWVVMDNIIEDNNSDTTGAEGGMMIGMAKHIRVERNRIADTRVGGARTQTVGVLVIAQVSVREVEDITLRQNESSNHTSDGILVTNAAPGTIERVLLDKNLSTDNGRYGIWVVEDASGNIKKTVATSTFTARNVTGTVLMSTSDGVIN